MSKADILSPETTAPLDRRLAELAARQHGVVASRQLRALGLGARGERHRVAAGRLHRMHRGVYAVGHTRVSPDGYAMAAVLAVGPGAVLSHRSAAALWGIRRSARARHEVTTTARRRPAGIDVHTARRLDPEDVTQHRGVPTTTVPRTLVDLADRLPVDPLATALHEAEVLRLFDRSALEAAIGRATGRRGLTQLREALREPDAGRTRSELERAFLRLCRDAGLPRPEVNATLFIDGRLVDGDALWRQEKVIVELDGAAVHATSRAFHADRRRDTALIADGYVVARLTWHRVTAERRRTADELRRILAVRSSAAWRPSPSTSA